MKLLVILALTVAVVLGKKCNKGTDSSALTEETCTGEVSTCTSPVFVEYTGMSSQAYGCGECTDANTCSQCTTTDTTACNTAVSAPAEAKTFDCYAYTYDETAKKWNAAAKATTCNAKKDTAVKCNSPGEKAEKAYTQNNGGCGACAAGTVDAKTCVECEKTGCNKSSAATFAFVLVPLMAAIFNLL